MISTKAGVLSDIDLLDPTAPDKRNRLTVADNPVSRFAKSAFRIATGTSKDGEGITKTLNKTFSDD